MWSFLDKKQLFIIALISLSFSVKGQQNVHLSQYMFNLYDANLAYAGNNDGHNFGARYRTQWVGLEGAPTSEMISYNASSKSKKIGYGATLMNETIGAREVSVFKGSYAYRLNLNKNILSMGLAAGVINQRFKFNNLLHRDANDPIIENGNKSWFTPVFEFGAILLNNKYYLGVEISHIIESEFVNNGDNSGKYYRDYTFVGGYVFPLGEEFFLRPSFVSKYTTSAPLLVDYNLSLMYKDILWAGIGYKNKNAWEFMCEFNIKKSMRIGYAFDNTISKIQYGETGSHELFLGITVGKEKSKTSSPRLY